MPRMKFRSISRMSMASRGVLTGISLRMSFMNRRNILKSRWYSEMVRGDWPLMLS